MVILNDHGGSLQGDKAVLKMTVVMAIQLCESPNYQNYLSKPSTKREERGEEAEEGEEVEEGEGKEENQMM